MCFRLGYLLKFNINLCHANISEFITTQVLGLNPFATLWAILIHQTSPHVIFLHAKCPLSLGFIALLTLGAMANIDDILYLHTCSNSSNKYMSMKCKCSVLIWTVALKYYIDMHIQADPQDQAFHFSQMSAQTIHIFTSIDSGHNCGYLSNHT